MNTSAEQVLGNARALYAECEAYSDRGVLEETSDFYGRRARFMTAFSRPDELEFTFDDEETTGLVVHCVLTWRSGKTTMSCFGEMEEPESLDLGVAGASGATSGAAHMIPALLIHDAVSGWQVTELVSPRLLRRDAFDGTDCWTIEGGNPNTDTRFTVSVGVVKPLIYRVDDHSVIDGRHHRTVVMYRPEARRPPAARGR